MVNVSTTFHRLAKLAPGGINEHQADHPALLGLLATSRRLLEKPDAGAPQCQALSNVTWSLATLQVLDVSLLRLVVVLGQRHLASFKPFELSSMLWALAKIGSTEATVREFSAAFFANSAKHIPSTLSEFSFRCLVMTSWAFATARQCDPVLFNAMAARIAPEVPAANCREVADTAWAFSSAGVHHEGLFSRLAVR